ncbi:MAG: hypothetical protein WBN23_16040 [Woeseia sp.]
MGTRTHALASPALIAGLILTVAGPAAYACRFPDPVPIPDGTTATEPEMIKADRAIKVYVKRIERYADCINAGKPAGKGAGAGRDIAVARLREEQAAQDQNRAAAAIENVAERFNKAVADYKSRNQL